MGKNQLSVHLVKLDQLAKKEKVDEYNQLQQV